MTHAAPADTHHRVIFGDARRMTRLADKSVHLIVTSPPYWKLKDYGSAGQIGYRDSYEDYINNLNLVWMECARVLHPGCRLCINIGDQFARAAHYGRYKVISIRTEIIRFCETIGFDFMGAIIWQKVTTCNTSGGGAVMGSFPNPRNGVVKQDYEHILLFKKPGKAPTVPAEIKQASRLSTEEWNSYFNGHWNFSGEKQDGHLAMFPLELPHRLIRMFSFVGETILDPFLGSGTTSRAARTLSRNSVGYEINREFEELIAKKAGPIAVEEDESTVGDNPFAALPYRFSDPVALSAKVDPAKQNYGSRVDDSDLVEKNPTVLVREVISPTSLEVADGRRVELYGVTVSKSQRERALAFLTERVRGKRVYLKDDGTATVGTKQKLVYLKNRTFINAHLVKNGCGSIDRAAEMQNRTLRQLQRHATADADGNV